MVQEMRRQESGSLMRLSAAVRGVMWGSGREGPAKLRHQPFGCWPKIGEISDPVKNPNPS